MQPTRPALSFSIWLTVAFVGLFALIWLLGSVLTPFVVAGILAYILEPLCDRLVKWKVSPTIASLLVMLLLVVIMLALMMLILPMIYRQVASLLDMMPAVGAWIENQLVPTLSNWLGTPVSLDAAQIQTWITANLSQVKVLAISLLPSIKTGTAAVFSTLANLTIIPLVMFYFLRDWKSLIRRISGLVPKRVLPTVSLIAGDADRVLGEFLRGQLSVMLVMAVLYSVGLSIAGLDFSISIGLIAGLLVFIPYIGMAIGLLLATLAGALQFDHIQPLIAVWLVFGVGQFIEGFVVTPWLVGERIGLHPVAVVFALMTFGQLFGFVGVLLALPMAACVLVALRHAKKAYINSEFYRQS
ncbi:AI-2E family transporter [Leeia sp. TBRC 13508]|uniref:AI-2E family transporter n=1 Tax=Leeia speluncae TaxID=2884804 RepID=A0ABS8D2Y9_9NEIS|nr:AI-2E family transporter [Leeia speluncae]MCB6182539.1 AI-2E family transporter [Leeia speluncae]